MSESGRCQEVAELPKITETTPHTATYTFHDIQNVIKELMSILETEHVVEVVGNVFYSIKVSDWLGDNSVY